MTAIETRERPPRSSSSLAVQSPACLTPQTGFSAGPLTVTLVNECEVVTHGVRRLLQPFSDRVRVTDEVGASEAARHIVLFDCFPVPGRIGTVVAKPRPAYARGRVVAYSWETRAACVDAALRSGFEGFLGKSLTGSELVAALEAVVTSSNVVSPPPEPERRGSGPGGLARGGATPHGARDRGHRTDHAMASATPRSRRSSTSATTPSSPTCGRPTASWASPRVPRRCSGASHTASGRTAATLVEPRTERRHEC